MSWSATASKVARTTRCALYLPKLDPGTIKALKTRLDALPEGGNPAVGLRACEEKTLEWFIRKVKSAKDKESLVALLAPFAVLADQPEGKARDSAEGGRALLDECGGTAAGVLKFAEATRPSYGRMAEKMALPLAQFEKEFERETMRQAGNPVFKVFFPALAKVRRSQARADVRRALLSAAFAVQLDGPDALKTHPDPVVGGPFEYARFAGGFELRSKFEQDGHELEVRRFAIASFQVGQEDRPFLLGSRLPHDLATVQRLTLARWFSGRAIRQQVFHGERPGMRACASRACTNVGPSRTMRTPAWRWP